MEAGLLAVYIDANNTSQSSILLPKSDITLINTDLNRELTPTYFEVASETKGKTLEAVGALFIIPLLLPGVIISISGTQMIRNAMRINHNLLEKELHTRTIDPDQSARGLVYFKVSEEDAGNWYLRIRAQVLGKNRKDEVLQLKCAWEN